MKLPYDPVCRSVSHNFLRSTCLFMHLLSSIYVFIYSTIYLYVYFSHSSIYTVYLYTGESCQRGAARPLLQRASGESQRLRPGTLRQQRSLRIEHQQQPISNFASFTTATTGNHNNKHNHMWHFPWHCWGNSFDVRQLFRLVTHF